MARSHEGRRAGEARGGAGLARGVLRARAPHLAGVPATKVELVEHAPLEAIARPARTKPTGKLVISSADTPHLMPIVAVAPRGFVEAHAHELEIWAHVWLAGVTHLAADVPAGARQVAAAPGAPPVLAIIEGLGQLEFANLRGTRSRSACPAGALTLNQTFRTAWRIWRDTGILTTPPPEVSPLEPRVIATLARTEPGARGAAAAHAARGRQAAGGARGRRGRQARSGALAAGSASSPGCSIASRYASPRRPRRRASTPRGSGTVCTHR